MRSVITIVMIVLTADAINFKFDNSKKCQNEYTKMINDNEKHNILYHPLFCKRGTVEYKALRITNKRTLKKLFAKVN